MDAFEKAVRKALNPIEGTFAFESMVQNHLNVDKYRPQAEFINQLKPVKDAVLFSSGCGSGNEFPAFFDIGVKAIYGVEVEDYLVDLAQARFKGSPEADRVFVELYDGDHLPYEDAKFDIITSNHVIEHVRDYRLYIRELFRVLKPGGLLFIDYPNRFFRTEQHTGLPLIQVFPHPLAQGFIWLTRRYGQWIPAFKRNDSKFKALEGYRPPFPGDIIRAMRQHGQPLDIEIEQAYFHNYDPYRITFADRYKRLRTWFQHMTTFRVLCRRKG